VKTCTYLEKKPREGKRNKGHLPLGGVGSGRVFKGGVGGKGDGPSRQTSKLKGESRYAHILQSKQAESLRKPKKTPNWWEGGGGR